MRLVASFACALALAACGGDPPSETAAPTAPPAPALPPVATTGPLQPAACGGADLSLAVSAQDAGAGNRIATLAFTNTGAAACTLQGYPDIALLAEDGQPRSPFRFEQSPAASDISAVMLQPGGQAWFDLATTAVAGEIPGETEPCAPVTAVRASMGGASVDAPIKLNPCNQRARVTPVRATAQLATPQ
jgi:hypothetical protein